MKSMGKEVLDYRLEGNPSIVSPKPLTTKKLSIVHQLGIAKEITKAAQRKT